MGSHMEWQKHGDDGLNGTSVETPMEGGSRMPIEAACEK